MGLYLNPRTDKKRWVQSNGMVIQETSGEIAFNYGSIPSDKVLVCVAENFAFDAAAVAFSESEFKAFNRPDGRNKTWALVPRELAKKESDTTEWNKYMKDN